MKETTSYELTYIVREDQKNDEVAKVLQERQAEIIAENDLGARTLAYEIKKVTQGHYFRIVFECSRENIKKIEKDLQSISVILRYLIVNTLRRPVETERRLPQEDRKTTKPTEIKNEMVVAPPKAVEQKEETAVVELQVEEKSDTAKQAKAEEKTTKEAKVKTTKTKTTAEKPAKAEAKKPKTIRKATKAEASELDKKLEELVKED